MGDITICETCNMNEDDCLCPSNETACSGVELPFSYHPPDTRGFSIGDRVTARAFINWPDQEISEYVLMEVFDELDWVEVHWE